MRWVTSRVAIPSFIQGISTTIYTSYFVWVISNVAIPSFIQGISTHEVLEKEGEIYGGRNPFLYSGHFNKLVVRTGGFAPSPIVAIPSFIQGISTLLIAPFVPLILYGVAIPSFIQGISTGMSLKAMM